MRDSLGDRGGNLTRPASVVEAFARNAGRSPEKLCLRFEGEDWSYGRLLERVGTFAGALRTWVPSPHESGVR